MPEPKLKPRLPSPRMFPPVDHRWRGLARAVFALPASILTASILTASILMAGATLASEDAEQVRALAARGEVLPLEQLLDAARNHKPGNLIEADLDWEPEHDLAVYELLMLGADGELWELEFDARTGKLLELEREHH